MSKVTGDDRSLFLCWVWLSPALSAVGVSLTLMGLEVVADLKILECIYKHIINPEGRLTCSCREITRPFTPSESEDAVLWYQSWHLMN